MRSSSIELFDYGNLKVPLACPEQFGGEEGFREIEPDF